MLPQLPPHQGHRVCKGGARFALPRRAAHAGRSLRDPQLGRQCDERVEAQQRRGGASNRTRMPLVLRFHPQMRPRFFQRHFQRPVTDKPGQPLRRRIRQPGLPRRPARACEPGPACGPRGTRGRGIREGRVKTQPRDDTLTAQRLDFGKPFQHRNTAVGHPDDLPVRPPARAAPQQRPRPGRAGQ